MLDVGCVGLGLSRGWALGVVIRQQWAPSRSSRKVDRIYFVDRKIATPRRLGITFKALDHFDPTMIKAILVFNNHGKVRCGSARSTP